VAAALGYTMYTGTTYVKLDAPAGVQVVKGFASGATQFSIQGIDWGGVAKPAEGATFEQLTPEQRAVVARTLGYEIVDQQMFYNPDAEAGQQLLAMPLEGTTYHNADIDWVGAGLKDPGAGVGFDKLSVQQQELVLQVSGYRRFDGVVYHDAEAGDPAREYVLTFVEGADYQNADIRWSTVAIPEAGTAFADMTPEQQFRVLDQTGWTKYDITVYFKAGAGDKELMTSFTEGVDYRNADMAWGSTNAAETNRWILDDGTQKVVVVAVDENGDGTPDALRVTEAHPLLGQRGFGFLLTGTITNLADNHGLAIASGDDVVIRGNIDQLGAHSDLSLQSDRWVYLETAANIHGNIDIRGGVSATGVNLGGANAEGTSVYIHATSTLNTLEAGTSINLMGGKDVIIEGRVVAGGTIGETGVAWLGPDSTISVTAGERIVADSGLAAAKSITLRTTNAPGANDAGYGVLIASAGGLVVGGHTSDGSGGSVVVDAVGKVQVIGNVVSGGDVEQVWEDGKLVSETVHWSDEAGTVLLSAGGQLYLGGLAPAADGGEVEIGSTIRARTRVDLVGGASTDHIGVKMPGGARVSTADPDGIITITSEDDADIQGIVVAGGEIVDAYDALGKYLGSTRNTFGGESVIRITAEGQVRLGHDLMAGKTIAVRGGSGSGTPTEENPWADEGIVVGGNVHFTTWSEFSSITLSAGGDMSVLAPAWTQELTADGFVEFADGHLSADTSFELTVDSGTQVLRGIVTVTAASTAGNNGVGDLRDDLQAAIAAATFTVVASPATPAAVGTTRTGLPGADDVTVRLNDSRLMLSGNYAMSIAAAADGNAQRLGFTQIAATGATAGAKQSARGYAIDASKRGSIVNLGKADAPSGEITISGWIRAYSGINMYAGFAADGDQKVNLTATGVLETLSGGMALNPAGDVVLEGDLIARGRGSDIVINATKTIELRGSLTAQRDIIVTAGTDVHAGEVSLQTFGTGRLNTTDPHGRIILTGLNDVVIDSQIGTGNPDLGLLQINSTAGKLTLEDDGWLETGAMMVLGGQTVDLGGVIKSHSATAASYDWEVSITSSGDVDIHGSFELAGSLQVQAADDIAVHGTTLRVLGADQRLSLIAGDAIGIGSVLGATGGAVVEVDALLEAKAGGRLAVGADGQLFASGDDSSIVIRADSLVLAGGIRAGAHLVDPAASGFAWTGKRAGLDIRTTGSVVLGDGSDAGNLAATGRLSLQAGIDSTGLGFAMSRGSSVRVDATGRFDDATAPWTEADAGMDGAIDLRAEGDVQLRGNVEAADEGATIAVLSRSQVWVDGLVSAEQAISITGGTDDSRIGVLVDFLVPNVSGGTLDTGVGGTITVVSTDSILVQGVVGQVDPDEPLGALGDNALGQGKVGTLTMRSTGGDITLQRNVHVLDHVAMYSGNIFARTDARVWATGTGSDIYLMARNSLVVQGTYDPGTDSADAAIVKADRLVHLVGTDVTIDGIVGAYSETSGHVLVNAGRTLTVAGAGFLKSGKDIDMNVGVDMSWTRARMEQPIERAQLQGGQMAIRGQGTLQALGTITLRSGGNVAVDADASLTGTRTVTTTQYTTVADTVDVVTGYRQEATGTVQVPEITHTTTQVTEQVGTELVKVGSQYTTMDVTLEQTGYYNPNASDAQKYREYFIEGIDYFNTQVDWSNAGTEANKNQTAAAVTTSDYRSADYKAFNQLSAAQKQAVLNHLGYMPLYQLSYSNYVVHRTVNGVTTDDKDQAPTWSSNAQKVYYVDVAGWRDKYINMPSGAQADILRVVSQGQAQYLVNDTSADGTNNDTNPDGSKDNSKWSSLTGGTTAIADVDWASYGLDAPAANATVADLSDAQRVVYASLQGITAVGELVGTYQDSAMTTYTQIASSYTGGAPAGGFSLLEDGAARWQVDYNWATGQRAFTIAGRTDNGTMMRDPNWYFEAHPELNTTTRQIGYAAHPYTTYTGMSDFANSTHKASDSTDLLRSWLTYQDALENDTT
jgi:hypothetical protein